MSGRRIKYIIISLTLLFIAVEGIGYYIAHKPQDINAGSGKKQNLSIKILKAKNWALQKKIESFSPTGVNILVDTASNVLYLRSGNKTVRKADISCGSGNILKDPSGKREWVFDTPRGEYSVRSKLVNPTWIKPDWAFIEEGEAIPSKLSERMESGVLGKYALGFGNGYFIHGTLYTRLLGRNVSHGCIRAGDKDLEYVFKEAPLGAKITIF